MLTGDEDLPDVEVLEDERREGGPAPARRRLVRYAGPENTTLVARRLMILVPVSSTSPTSCRPSAPAPSVPPATSPPPSTRVVDSLRGRADRRAGRRRPAGAGLGTDPPCRPRG